LAAVGEPLLGNLKTSINAYGLKKRTSIRGQSQPCHAVNKCINIFFGRAFAIRILNPQNKSPAMASSVQPEKSAVRTLLRCKTPVGLGTKRARTVMCSKNPYNNM
jgi:hypothetical protein